MKAWHGMNDIRCETVPEPKTGGSVIATVLSIAAGLALVALSLPRGTLSGEHYGGWDRMIV